MILHRPRSLEQRNDFFDLAHLTIMVYGSVTKHIDPVYVARSMPLFRNARTTVEPYRIGNSLNRVDFHFQLVITNHFNKRLQGWIAYSLPVFHEHLNLYIRYADIGYHERSYRILLIIMLPVSLMGVLLCLSLHLALHVSNARTGGESTHPSLTPVDSFVWLVGIIAQQGSSVRPTATSSMIIILVALGFSAIVYCTYLAKITAQLSVDVEVNGNLLALLAEEQYRIGFVGNFTSEQTFLGQRYDPAMHEVMRRMQHDKSLYVFSHEEGLQRVLTSKYALIGDAGTVRMAMQDFGMAENCNITEINLDGIEQMVALQMSSTYAYRKMINYQ
uniref:Ionotropic glutamate receptor C-terminal domain-containing protein n=1 Tax=Anopheles dirus TaxID=7168 RepID=A0A182N6J1_9DIPT